MHDIRFIRENPEAFDAALSRRGLTAAGVSGLIALDRESAARDIRARGEQRRHAATRRRKRSAKRKKNKDEEKAQRLMAEVADAEVIDLRHGGARKKQRQKNSTTRWREIPNLPLDDVPDGKNENDNVERHRFGARRDYAFKPKQHFELGEALGQMDFETAAKLSGARFVVLKKGLARLERALGQFMLDVHTSEPHNYTEVVAAVIGARRGDVRNGAAAEVRR